MITVADLDSRPPSTAQVPAGAIPTTFWPAEGWPPSLQFTGNEPWPLLAERRAS